MNEKKYLKENREQEQSKAIGNYLESTYWTEQDIRDGQSIVLEVFRDGKSLNITGKIQQQQTYLNADNRLTIGVNGPTRLSNDGFASAWINWYEKFVAYTRHYIDDKRWERSTIDNRRLLAEYYEWRERIGYLLIHYPGRFANTVLADWEKVRQIFEGVTYTDITEEDLEYRKIGEQRALLVKEAAIKGHTAFIQKSLANMIPAFPAMDPVHGNILEVAGKITTVPTITYDQFINDLGKSYAVIGSAQDRYYFIHLNSKELDVFFKTLFHYQAQVTPDIKECYQFFAEILNEPTMLSYGGKAITGLMVKVLAGMAGESNVFIDIGKAGENGIAIFEGEEALKIFAAIPLDDAASPQQVIEAMIYYIKLGDMAAWRKLFCNWQIYSEWEGPPFMGLGYFFTHESYQHTWEQSRRQILNDIFDARVLYSGPVKTVVEENKRTGVPKVEQVKIIIDHVGKFEGVYRSVSNLYVHRKWVLQRLNGGPWKIKEQQAL